MRVAYQVHGHVQGVGYRYHAAHHGQVLQLAGWVSNAFDGTVVGEVEGEAAALDVFREALVQGPHMSRVTRVDWYEAQGVQTMPFPFVIR